MSKIRELLVKTAAHALLGQTIATKQAEEIALYDLAHKAAMDEIDSTVDALVKVGGVNANMRKEAAASLASHSGALVSLRKLAGMITKHRTDTSVAGPGDAVTNKTAGDSSRRTVRDEANEDFMASQQ